MPRMQVPKKLQPIFQEVADNIVLIGGRGSAKSRTVGQKALMDCQTKGIKTACFREHMNTIDDSMHSLLTRLVGIMELEGFDCQDKRILYKGADAFKYRGMARNVEGIQSMDDFHMAIVEEAQTASAKSIRTIIPTFREDGAQMTWVANPRHSADPFSQRFIKPFEKKLRKDGYYKDDQHLIIICNWRDNPFRTDKLNRDRAFDKIHMTEAMYDHVWEGAYLDEVENCIIPVKWFDAAIDAHIKLGFKPQGAKVVAHDPSDEGDDDKGLALRQGSVILDVQTMETGDIHDGCDWALDYCESVNADHFVWDADGMGIALKKEVSNALNGRKITYAPFHGGGQVDNPDSVYNPIGTERKPKINRHTFKNLRSQRCWGIRDRFYNTYNALKKGQYVDPDTLISISSKIDDIDGLRAETCRIPLKHNNAGYIQIMSKQEMASLPEPILSPNMFDSVMMSDGPIPSIVQLSEPLHAASLWG